MTLLTAATPARLRALAIAAGGSSDPAPVNVVPAELTPELEAEARAALAAAGDAVTAAADEVGLDFTEDLDLEEAAASLIDRVAVRRVREARESGAEVAAYLAPSERDALKKAPARAEPPTPATEADGQRGRPSR